MNRTRKSGIVQPSRPLAGIVAGLLATASIPSAFAADFTPTAHLYGNATGSHTISGGVYTIANSSGSGIDAGSSSDGFYSLEQVVTGDFYFTVRVDSATDVVGNSSEYERVGIVVRTGAVPADNEISAFAGYDSTTFSSKWGYWVTRDSVGAGNVKTTDTSGFTLPRYVRMTRVGDLLTGEISPDGSSWTPLGATTRSGPVRIGLAWASDSTNAGTAVFSDLTFSGTPPPVSPYAWYRADAGITLDGSGFISLWETQTATAHDLDRIIASPTTVSLPRSGGGSATVVSLDGSSALWAASVDWGSLAGDRTVVARARLKGTGDGFLFDGSTNVGKTRAQVRNGMWQVGVQSSGASFASADPDTGPLTTAWQTHVFEYDESGGNTLVTHWVDGVQTGNHSVAVDTALGGIIVGANGGTGGPLEVELAELRIYDQLLNSADRADVETELDTAWGDLIDLPFAYQTNSVQQTAATVPHVGIHGVISLTLTSSGNLASYSLTNITYHINGTTNPADIEEVHLYSSNGNPAFDANQATLLATAPAPVGPDAFSVNAPITAAEHTFWIAVKLRGTSNDGDIIDAGITSFTIDGAQAGTYTPAVTEPPESLTIGNTFYSLVLRKGGDDGSGNFRIPGLVTTTNGTLIAVFDIRWDGSSSSAPDLPANIDVGVMRSTDGGFTWGPMQVIMDYDQSVPGSSGNGVGDPAVLVDRVNGRIWCAALWSKGNNGWFGSGPGLTPDETGQYVLNYSDDDGLTWSAPVSITPDVKDPAWNLYFQGPGKGICTRDGILVFPSQYKDSGATPRSNFIYSTDRGATWQNAPPAIPSGNPWTTEAQIVELDTGDLLLSMRNHDGSRRRLWCVYSWNHATETIADGAWGTPWFEQTDPTVMASVERYRSTLDGHPWSGLLFANPDNTSRSKMSVRLSLDEGLTWPYKKKIDDRPAAYSCMTLLPDGDIGLLYETGDSSSIATLVFARFPLEWIVGTTDTDLDGIPDFHEDALGLDKGDPDDADDDPDMDDMTNLEEFVARTLPFSSASVLRASISSQGATNRISWEAVPYVHYRLDMSPSLAPPDWTAVSGLESMMANSTNISVNTPASPSEENRFYRVALP